MPVLIEVVRQILPHLHEFTFFEKRARCVFASPHALAKGDTTSRTKSDLAKDVARRRVVEKMPRLQLGQLHCTGNLDHGFSSLGCKAQSPIGTGDPISKFKITMIVRPNSAAPHQTRRATRAGKDQEFR